MSFWYYYFKERIMLFVAIASGRSVRSNANVKVNVTVKGSYVLLDANYNQVTYQIGKDERTEIVVNLCNSPRNTNKMSELGLNKTLLNKKYRFVGATTHGRGYHLLRFAETLQ